MKRKSSTPTRRAVARPAPKAKRKTAARKSVSHPTSRTSRSPRRARSLRLGPVDVQDTASLSEEIDRLSKRVSPARWNADPDDVQRSVVKLVLTLVEFLRQLLERQAIRRMDAGTISADETEAIGLALMRLEETIRDLGARFDLTIEDLNLDLGPAGRLI